MRVQGTLEWGLAVILLGGLGRLESEKYSNPWTLLMIASVTIVLSTLFLSAAFTSGRIAKTPNPII